MEESYNDWINAMNRIDALESVLRSIARAGVNRDLDRADAYMMRDKARAIIADWEDIE